MISYIVSVFDRIGMLNACLATLAVQESPRQIIICANHTDSDVIVACGVMGAEYEADLKTTGRLGAKSCYESAEMVTPHALGEWLCFPSDDSLYVADFARIMLDTAAKTGADVVHCNCVYKVGSTNNRAWPHYSLLESEPRMGKIDKTNFIVRRSLFNGFPEHPRDWRDGALMEQLNANGAKFAKAPGVLVVHQ